MDSIGRVFFVMALLSKESVMPFYIQHVTNCQTEASAILEAIMTKHIFPVGTVKTPVEYFTMTDMSCSPVQDDWFGQGDVVGLVNNRVAC
jgi:hypothetical protein